MERANRISIIGGSKMSKNSAWNWYGVKIIKQIIVEGEPDKDLIDEFYTNDDEKLFEESIMIVRAQSFDHAYKIAETNANKATNRYLNVYNQQVTWKLIKAVDCFRIYNEIKSGAEVYSCFHDTYEVNESN